MDSKSQTEREVPEGFVCTIKLLLEDLKNTKQFADMVLISSDNCKFPCHKLILALSSPILRNMFQDLVDMESLMVFLPFIHSSLLSKFLDILYTGNAKVNTIECEAIGEVFDHLEITKNFVNIFEEDETIVKHLVSDDNFQTLHIVEDETIEDVKNNSIESPPEPILLDVIDIKTISVEKEESSSEKVPVRFFCTFENCGKSYSRNCDLIAHNRVHTGERPYACIFCESKYPSITEMRRHMLKVHNHGERVACGQCGKTFRDSNNLKTHMSVHTGLKPFKCELCPSTFAQKNDLVKHGRIHSTDEPFKCDTCDMTFKWKHTLKRHVLTHTGEKKFKCDYCDLKFRQNFDLNKHKRIHTGEENYCCKYCDRRFSRQDYLSKHLLTHDKQEKTNGDVQDVEKSDIKDGDFTIVDGELVTVMDCDGETFLVCDAGDAFAFQTEVEITDGSPAMENVQFQ